MKPTPVFLGAVVWTIASVAAPSAVLAAPTRRARTTRSSTNVRARVQVRPGRVSAAVRHDDGRNLEVTIAVPRTCDAKRMADVVAHEVVTNPDAFWTHNDMQITLSQLPYGVGSIFDQGDRRPGLPGSDGRGSGREDGDDNGKGAEDPPDTFAAGIADVLATGQHDRGTRGAGGETCFDGINFDVGSLVQFNGGAAPADGSVSTAPNGDKIVTEENKDGSTTTTTLSSDMKSVLSTSTTKTTTSKEAVIWSDGHGSSLTSGTGTTTTTTTVTTDNTSGTVIASTTTKSGNTSRTHSQTKYKDGSSSETVSTTKAGSDGSKTTISQTDDFDADGKHTGGKTTTQQNGQTTGSAKTPPDKNKDKKKGDGAVKLTPEGSVSMPPMCVPDEVINAIINWNKLQAAVTDPAPNTDSEGKPIKVDAAPPCGGKPSGDGDFDPDPAYLRPNKQGWVTDPVPALRRSTRRNGIDR